MANSVPQERRSQSVTAWLKPDGGGINVKDSLEEIKEFAYKTFDQIDLDGDGFLSRQELNAAFSDTITGWREKSFLLFLIRRVEDISNAYDEEWAPKGNGFSRVDLQEYFEQLEVGNDGSVRPTTTAWMGKPTGGIHVGQTMDEIKNFALDTFDSIDIDGDGFLSKNELYSAYTDDEMTWRQKSFLIFLINKIDDIEKAFHEEWAPNTHGISRMDVQEYFRKLKNG